MLRFGGFSVLIVFYGVYDWCWFVLIDFRVWIRVDI